MAAVKNIEIATGVTYSHRVIWHNAEDDSAFDLTGYVGTAQVREMPSSKKTICNMTVTLNDADAGDFTISIPKTTTADLKPGIYHWDCLFTGSTQTLRPMAGTATVVQTVTQ